MCRERGPKSKLATWNKLPRPSPGFAPAFVGRIHNVLLCMPAGSCYLINFLNQYIYIPTLRGSEYLIFRQPRYGYLPRGYSHQRPSLVAYPASTNIPTFVGVTCLFPISAATPNSFTTPSHENPLPQSYGILPGGEAAASPSTKRRQKRRMRRSPRHNENLPPVRALCDLQDALGPFSDFLNEKN